MAQSGAGDKYLPSLADTLAPMLVLLPPSQGKAQPVRGRRIGLSTLVYPRLRDARERLVNALDPELLSAPAIPAQELYTGVLFGALDLPGWPLRASSSTTF